MTLTRAAGLIFLLGAVPFLLLLGFQDVANTHEARVAQTARETAASGWPWRATPVEVPSARLVTEGGRKFLKPDPSAPPLRVNPWVVPVLTGDIRLQKPPLPYWCAAVLFRLFGEGAWAARFVPALLGALATPILYDLAWRMLGRRAATAAALVWVSSYFVVSEFRKAMADPYLAFFTLACVWTWVRASGARMNSRPGASAGWLVAFYLSLAMGLMAKGPVVLVHVPLALAAYHACYRRPLPASAIGHAAGVLFLLAIALPWPLAVWRSVPHAVELWRYESVGELADNRRNAAPFWAYLPKLPYLALPWTPLWVAALVYPVRRLLDARDGTFAARLRLRRLMFAPAWYGATVLFFSVVNLKKDAYLLPVMAAQTLLIAQLLCHATALVRAGRPPRWLGVIGGVQVGIGAGAALALAFLLLGQVVDRDFAKHDVPLLVVATALAAGAAFAPWRRRTLAQMRQSPKRWIGPWFTREAVSAALVVTLFLTVYAARKENRRSPRPFAEAVLRRLAEGESRSARALYRSSLPPTVAFYLPLDTGREDTARTILVVGGRSGRAPDVAAAFTAETGQPVSETKAIELEEGSNPDRWTLFELTLANRRGFASAR